MISTKEVTKILHFVLNEHDVDIVGKDVNSNFSVEVYNPVLLEICIFLFVVTQVQEYFNS